MDLESKILPWRPHVIVTGQSFYSIDSATGKIAAQRDTWDSVSDNNYLSVEGLAYIIRSLTDPKVSCLSQFLSCRIVASGGMKRLRRKMIFREQVAS